MKCADRRDGKYIFIPCPQHLGGPTSSPVDPLRICRRHQPPYQNIGWNSSLASIQLHTGILTPIPWSPFPSCLCAHIEVYFHL
ncbi:hypothetical protein KC19_VG032300 [Ceratodon purpureus]|uniref:Uncharacterized protein n=1 Tax=Ceratodon purpureus TaxID=3225 RepID=A0A8T0HLH3_CERPU|nr:hypothetical protein KC19_VG032300 [Ceratodon purpureus]